ncbi:MAG: hypothetical protein ACRD01_16565 [Terriglobales bacterium]
MTAHQDCTAMTAAPTAGLVLPASLIPVVPLPPTPDGVPAMALRGPRATAMLAPLSAGFLPNPFHPPQAPPRNAVAL